MNPYKHMTRCTKSQCTTNAFLTGIRKKVIQITNYWSDRSVVLQFVFMLTSCRLPWRHFVCASHSGLYGSFWQFKGKQDHQPLLSGSHTCSYHQWPEVSPKHTGVKPSNTLTSSKECVHTQRKWSLPSRDKETETRSCSIASAPLTLQLFSSSAFTTTVPHFLPGIPLWTNRTNIISSVTPDWTPDRKGRRTYRRLCSLFCFYKPCSA